MNYILDDCGQPHMEPDIWVWAEWFEKSREKRRVAETVLPSGIKVSTVFLAIDHSFG